MRTKTNVYIGDGAEGFARILKNFYRVGNVDLVFDTGTDAAGLVKTLKKYGYEVTPIPTVEYEGREYFALAVGRKAFVKVKNRCIGKFCHYVTFLTLDMFAGENYPEFLYFDGKNYSTEKISAVRECYTALLSATTEGLADYYKSKAFPFVDRGLKRLLERAKTVLTGEGDKDNYISDCIAISKEIVESIYFPGRSFTAAEMAENLGGTLGDYAEAACFLSRGLILFTKWKFSDMLITVDKPVTEVTEGYPFYGEADLILGEKEMKKVFAVVEEYRSRNGLSRLITAFNQSVKASDIAFAEIYNRGIYEGILGYD